MATKVIVQIYDGVGGPQVGYLAPDGFWAGPTDPGEFVVAYCGRHRSRSRYPLSSIPWGATLKEEEGEVLVRLDGAWKKVQDLTGWDRDTIMEEHLFLYRVRKVPATWVFNDFGHMACFLFKDFNKNRKMDKDIGERIAGEFIHTTPVDEARTALGRRVDLTESHGCVHVKPVDIDAMIKHGYMGKGTKVVVHRYTEMAFGYPQLPGGRSPFELHFYPGMMKLVVVGTRPY